ncbi:hypothetical protein ACQP2Y_42880 [Actinoplanes sp. CA-051413]|uniref:hypothetical protein n=1 Tax=Actinoplanes sp. CA-051413 TaxID=3239899 RepID=UPI003D980EE7
MGTAPADDAEGPDRSVFRRLVDLDEEGVPAPVGAAPTDLRLATLSRADDPGEPADQEGDPELDIDQDLDRAADVIDPAEQSHALDLPGLGLLGLQSDAELSGPFDSLAGAEGTGTFSGLFADVALEDADETGFVPVPEETVGTDWAERADRRYGDRVEGWVRPEYPDEPVAGEYWTPAPVGSYEAEYGWPTPVERLPEVPPYPPSSGFDVPVEIETEPTRPVLQWPPARPDDRIELPRSWSHRGGETGPAFRTAVDRDGPAGLRSVADLPIEDAMPDAAAHAVGAAHTNGTARSAGTAEGSAAFSDAVAHPLRDGDLVEGVDLASVDDLAEVDDLAGGVGLAGAADLAGGADPAGAGAPGLTGTAGSVAPNGRFESEANSPAARFGTEVDSPAAWLGSDANPPNSRFDREANLPAGRFGNEAIAPAPEVTGRRRFDEPVPAADDRVFLGTDGLTLAPNPYVHEDEPARPSYSRAAQAARRLAESPVQDAPTGGAEHEGARDDRRDAASRRDRRNTRGRRDRDSAPQASAPLASAPQASAPQADAPQDAGPLTESHAPRANHPAPGAWPPPAAYNDRPADQPQRARATNTAGPNRVPVRRGPATDQSGPYAAREESLEGPIWTVPDLPEAAMPDLTWSPEEAPDDTRRSRRPAVMVRRRRAAGAEATQALPPMEPARPDQPRARPRPRPRPGAGQPEPRSTVYVSRHAAEPS